MNLDNGNQIAFDPSKFHKFSHGYASTVYKSQGASIKDVFHLVKHRIVDAVSLKVPKLGGLWNTLTAAQICRAGNVKFRFGAHVGSQLLNAHAMHLAATLPDVWYVSEFGEFSRLLDDPFNGIKIKNGIAHLPNAHGAGVSPT